MKAFYHKADFDGQASGIQILDKYNDCEMIGIDYDTEFPWDTIDKTETVYMVDFALQPFSDMVKLNDSCDLIWIDHHSSAIDEAKKANVDDKIVGLRLVGEAGCELTWRWLNLKPGDREDPEAWQQMPPGLRLLGRYDVWDHTDDKTLPFQFGLRAYTPDVDMNALKMWDNIFNDEEFIESVVEQGETILKYVSSDNAEYVKTCAFETELDGHKCIAVNRSMGNSQLFDSVWDPKKYDFMVAFYYKDDQWTISLYTDEDNIDVGEIAKKHGGGGHKGAAGFQVDKLWFDSHGDVDKEEIANLCHEQWSGWMDYQFGQGTFNDDGTWTMPKEYVERWQRQVETDYKDLSNSEQDSDRTEADKFISLMR